MRTNIYRASLYLSLSSLMAMLPSAARAASYLPLPDADLARRSPLIVRAEVLSQETRLESEGDRELVCTLTTFRVLETLKGRLSSGTVRVELPGGEIGGMRTEFPGTPDFAASGEVILFLAPSRWHGADHSLTELGLSHFEVVEDPAHHRFAVRPAFGAEEDDFLAQRIARPAPALPGTAWARRDAESFLASLRSSSSGGAMRIEYASPAGELRSTPRRARALWVNIGGVENGSRALFRWFWDTGRSPNATVSVSGTQSNLSDGSDGSSRVQNAANSWHGVAASDVRISYLATGGNIVVNLDVDNQGTAWTTSLACGTGGVVGYGGPGPSPSAGNFKGDSPYYAIPSGTVWMRHLTGGAGCYPIANFESGVLHEMGHTLGLGHPDQDASVHSALCPFATCTAVMRSTLTGATTPQPDDIFGIQWYYGVASANTPVANFTSAATTTVGSAVSFSDTSTGGPLTWNWSFGDGTAGSVLQNPTHTFMAPGAYSVTLTAGNASGSSSITKLVTVTSSSACVPDSQTLCLNNARFRVRVSWSVPSQGTSGTGTAAPLTSDTGTFWFFSPSNVELVIKALDGRPVNNKFWIFYGALSDVQYTITVTDTLTGAVRSYSNQQGHLASVADVTAFSPALSASSAEGDSAPAPEDGNGLAPAVALARASFLEDASQVLGARPTASPPPAGACSGNTTTLCLNQTRFTVRVSWAVPTQGTSGAGTAIALTADTGYFWFFSASNVELVVKVLDGRAVNNHFWVFFGALSDVQYTITVTDTQTGAVKVYSNTQGNLASVADVAAF
jgi:PKD repeat protein